MRKIIHIKKGESGILPIPILVFFLVVLAAAAYELTQINSIPFLKPLNSGGDTQNTTSTTQINSNIAKLVPPVSISTINSTEDLQSISTDLDKVDFNLYDSQISKLDSQSQGL